MTVTHLLGLNDMFITLVMVNVDGQHIKLVVSRPYVATITIIIQLSGHHRRELQNRHNPKAHLTAATCYIFTSMTLQLFGIVCA